MAKGTKTGGRKKGTPNKATAELKGMILEALAAAGGVAYLKRQATKSPSAFLALVGKVLPLTVKGDNDDGSLTITVKRFTPDAG